MLRKNPKRITFLAPIVTYFFTFCEGTGHCSYAILPAIAEIARGAGIRPERPMSIAVIASQQAVTASPIAAATASLLSILSGANISLMQIIICSFPATFVACMIGAFVMSRYGKELDVDHCGSMLGIIEDVSDGSKCNILACSNEGQIGSLGVVLRNAGGIAGCFDD